MKKKIAVVVSGVDEEYQSTVLRGLQDCAREHGTDVLHFVTFGGLMNNVGHDTGENNIYELCHFEEFDGVVLLTNTIPDSTVTSEIVKRLQACGVPVSSVDCDLGTKFSHVGIDNTRAMKEVVRHIVFDHGIRDIGYISGPPTNPESVMRYNAFESVMREAGIPVTDDMIFYGGFRSCDGADGAVYFCSRPAGVPRAIISANDAMAMATVLELEAHGLRVPEDVMVTGFDDTYAARTFEPAISSVRRPLYDSGRIAVEKILGLRPAEPRSIILDTEFVKRKSCGCNEFISQEAFLEDSRNIRKSSYKVLDYYQVNIPLVNRMSCALAECEDLQEVLRTLQDYVERMDCTRFYMCLNTNWNEVIREADQSGQKINLIDTRVTHGFTEQMSVPLAYVDGRFTSLPDFPAEQMMPACENEYDIPLLYFLLPLHFRDRGFGYVIFVNEQPRIENPLLHSWVMNIGNCLESLRKKEYLGKAMAELDQLYVMDPLCRINNRNGFNKYSAEIFEESCRAHKRVMMMFIDMDGLKMINDTYSHKEGDSALRQLAKCIRMSCKNGEVYARFGGDEFIVFAGEGSEEQAKALSGAIQERIDEYNQISGKPYPLMASIGWHIAEVDEESQLYPLITAADMKMYEEKKRKKVSRYLRHS